MQVVRSAVSLFMLYEAGFLSFKWSVRRSIKKTQVLMPVATGASNARMRGPR